MPAKRQFVENSFAWLTVPGFSLSSQEPETAGCLMSVVKSERNERMCAHGLIACAQLHLSSLIQCRSICLGNDAAHRGLSLPTTGNLVKTVPLHSYPL